jgi:hypothetical protein
MYECNISFILTFWFSGKSLYHLHSLLNIINMIKARIMNWAIYVICMAEKKNVCRFLICQSSHRMALSNLRMLILHGVLCQVFRECSLEESLYKTCIIQIVKSATNLMLTTYLEARFSTSSQA